MQAQLNQPEEEDRDVINGKKALIFIENLLKQTDGEMLSKTDIMNELKLIMVAGFETTASTMSFALLLLAQHPDVQQKVFDEIMTVVPTGDVQFNDCPKLEYLDRVIKETLRLFPILPLITRTVSNPITLNGGIVIPRDSQVMISALSIQRSPKYWGENANSFDPDRFLPENLPNTDDGLVYLPFGAGPRNCIGMKYALLAMKIIVAKMVRKYEFQSPLRYSDMKIVLNTMLRLENKHLVSVKERAGGW